jgi:hypothetical protein
MTMSNDAPRGSAMDIHRLLDEAFAGVAMNSERQDLKEEMRANLVARVAELHASGLPLGTAARQAIEELGDVRHVVDATAAPSRPDIPGWAHHRVRPRPGFLIRTVVAAAGAVAGLAILVLAATGLAVPFGGQLAAVIPLVVAAGFITADALRQETTSNHPMPTGRAAGYGVATAIAVVGLGSGWLWQRGFGPAWLIGGALAVVAAIVLFTYLGATQTNRHKQWVIRLNQSHAEAGDRFTNDPVAAARFGVYTLVTWVIALAAFVVLSLTAGWTWSWLALVGGFVTMMIMIARMLFTPPA